MRMEDRMATITDNALAQVSGLTEATRKKWKIAYAEDEATEGIRGEELRSSRNWWRMRVSQKEHETITFCRLILRL